MRNRCDEGVDASAGFSSTASKMASRTSDRRRPLSGGDPGVLTSVNLLSADCGFCEVVEIALVRPAGRAPTFPRVAISPANNTDQFLAGDVGYVLCLHLFRIHDITLTTSRMNLP